MSIPIDEAKIFLSALGLIARGGLKEVMPFASIILDGLSYAEKLEFLKMEAAAKQLAEDLLHEDPVRCQMALRNLQDKYGEETFAQVLVSKIKEADSVKRAKWIGRLVALSLKDDEIQKHYGDLLFVVTNLEISDFDFIEDGIKSSKENLCDYERKRDLYIDGEPNKFNETKYMAYFGSARLRRFNSVGLAKQSKLVRDDTLYWIDEKLGALVLRITQD